jgi:putative hemolysin
MGIDRLEQLYAQLPPGLGAREFAEASLAKLGVRYTVHETEWQRLPTTGPLLVAANHPYGGIDGLAAIAALMRHRSDLKVIATASLAGLAPLGSVMIPVDNFGHGGTRGANVIALRHALRHVKAGGALLVFPAGAVSHLDLAHRCVADPPWNRSASALLAAAGAPVAPLYVHGSNGAGFQLAGLLHPALRTALLPREVTNKRGTCLDLRLGEPVPPERLAALGDPQRIERLLRVRLYSLAAPRAAPRAAPQAPSAASASATTNAARSRPTAAQRPVGAAVPREALERELGALGEGGRLATLGPLEVYCAPGRAVPHLLDEIGRLREETFRAVGEGTGHARDLDHHDRWYDHIVAWDSRRGCVVGAYRAARIEQLRRTHGRNALYLSTLFEFREPFFPLLGPAIELGRSFVRAEYQRSFTSLLALWRGIGEYVAQQPRFARLIGPVSVSADYDEAARALLVRYLRWHHFDPLLAAWVKPRTPFREARSLAVLGREASGVREVDDLADVIAAGDDPQRRGAPVLLRQYLKLGGRVLGFNIDPDFGHSLDCLTVVDLTRTPDAVLSRYMREETLARFRAAHRRG